MTVTVTATILEKQTLHKRHDNQQLTTQPDANKMHIVSLALAGTYATGGFAVDANAVGLGRITEMFIHPPLAATIGNLTVGSMKWTGGNVLVSAPSATTLGAMTQLDNASAAITFYSGAIAVIFGY